MVRFSTAMLAGAAAALAVAEAAPTAAFAASPALPLASGRAAAQMGPTMQMNPRQPKVARRSFALRMSDEEKDDKSLSDSPLGSPLYGDSWDTPDMVPVDATPPGLFVLGGIIGCVPIAYALVQGCVVSLGYVPDQCVGKM